MSFLRTTAINKVLALKARKKVIQGGSSAGKTFGIIPILIDKACKTPNLEISIISESVPHLKKGAMKDFKKIMKLTGRWNENHWHDTDRKYTFSNGSYMEFFSPESVLGARRHILYVNEANHITYADYHQLSIRTEYDIYIDFNPASEFWAQTEVLKEPDSESLILTYLDNEARPTNVDSEFKIARNKAEEEKKKGLPVTSYWQNWCRVYIDGLQGNVQGLVFNNWTIVPEIPALSEFMSNGGDFGFTNDPTAILSVYKQGGELWVKQRLYETDLTNSDIIRRLAEMGIPLNQETVWDSAEPKSIEDLSRAGYNVSPAKKGPDSIKNSIDTLQSYKINVTADSTDLIRELRSYQWLTDKTGKALNEPCDHNNHLIDALRYVALNKLKGPDFELSVY